MDGNFPSQLLHQQVKTEGLLTAKAVTGAVQTDASRAAPASEQVVQQVRDCLVNHDTKPGTEQIVLRLSPEHLGELKVNLSLEGQRLKVEIVAENRMVRDSLMQHTDTLKESLSRQNIKMDSFEVTTGGNGSTDGGRGQGDWRELAQQRQHDAWMPNGGYRVAKLVEPAIAAYQLKSEHTMVDLHY
jgi:flagellar hook-length control protein FliK